MKKVLLEDHGPVALLRLAGGVTNAINPDLVADLAQGLARARQTHRALVLAGGEKFFSMGFDLPWLLKADRPAMADFLGGFNRLLLDLYALPLPTLAAARGHAVAGGTILALMCDWRVSASGRVFWGLNEVRLGVPVPYLADLALRRLVGERASRDITHLGELVQAERARELGLVDRLAERPEVEPLALELAAQAAALPAGAFAEIKSCRVGEVAERFAAGAAERLARFLDLWFSPEARELLGQAAQKF